MSLKFGNEHLEMKRWVAAVYKVVIDGKWFYIGSSVDVKRRLSAWKHYLSNKAAFKKNRSIMYVLQTAEDVNFEIVELITDGSAPKLKEDIWIKHYFDDEHCLNLAPSAISNKGRKLPLGVVRREKKQRGLPVPKKPIAQFLLDGTLVAHHESILAAATVINCKTDHIRWVIQGVASRYRGWLFKQIAADGSYIDPPPFKRRKGKSKIARRVAQYGKDGVFIASFLSSRIAAKHISGNRRNVENCIAGKNRMKSYKGFIWKYAD